jgi:hypothetical protein
MVLIYVDLASDGCDECDEEGHRPCNMYPDEGYINMRREEFHEEFSNGCASNF